MAAQEAPIGQQPQSMKGIVRKRMAPVSTEVLRVQLPKPDERTLKNGLPLLVIENHKVPNVVIELVLPATNLTETPDLTGVADCVADMMKLGTKTRDAKQIAEQLSELGATLSFNAEFGSSSTRLTASTLSSNLDKLIDLMADVLLNPTFPQDELDKWKTRQISQLQQARASEGFLGEERQRAVLYPDDGRRLVAPGVAEIKAITRDKLIAFYKANYRPGNSILGVSGDVRTASLTQVLDKALAGWESGSAPEPKVAALQPIPEKKIYLVDRPNSVQTLLILTNRAISRTSPDYIPVQVMNRILGGGPAGRLFRNIREDKGYTYGASSGFTAQKYLAYFGASSSVRTEVTEPALQEFLNEFRDIRDKPVPAEELEDAKRAIVANFALGLERKAFVLNQILVQREYGLPADYWETYPAKVMAVTAADVQRVAKQYVPLDNLQVIAVGDAAKIRGALAKFGPVEEYTAEGVKAPSGGMQ